jgi:carboxypeptidase C (cathepsin A)
MTDASQPNADTKEADKKMRERVDKLVAQAASESSGSITLAAKSLEYTVNAAFLPVVAEGLDGTLGEPEAAVMATSYALKGADARTRPVCFAFNGGPGSASTWNAVQRERLVAGAARCARRRAGPRPAPLL